MLKVKKYFIEPEEVIRVSEDSLATQTKLFSPLMDENKFNWFASVARI